MSKVSTIYNHIFIYLFMYFFFFFHKQSHCVVALVFLEGVIVVHYTPGCYSDVGDARLCRELVKEGLIPLTKK